MKKRRIWAKITRPEDSALTARLRRPMPGDQASRSVHMAVSRKLRNSSQTARQPSLVSIQQLRCATWVLACDRVQRLSFLTSEFGRKWSNSRVFMGTWVLARGAWAVGNSYRQVIDGLQACKEPRQRLFIMRVQHRRRHRLAEAFGGRGELGSMPTGDDQPGTLRACLPRDLVSDP